jgi:hypothetical protein
MIRVGNNAACFVVVALFWVRKEVYHSGSTTFSDHHRRGDNDGLIGELPSVSHRANAK